MPAIFIPHLKKVAVKDLFPGSDPSDPPLTFESFREAEELATRLLQDFGMPRLICVSPKVRCRQTAQPTIDQTRWRTPILVLPFLSQPENGDADSAHPLADERGLVYYWPDGKITSKSSTSEEWVDWYQASMLVIRHTVQGLKFPTVDTRDPIVFIFTHRPLIAVAKWGKDRPMTERPKEGEINPLDKLIFPYFIRERL